MITFFKKIKILFFSKDDMFNEFLERCERLEAANTLLLEAIKDKNNLLKKYIKTSKNAEKELNRILDEIEAEMRKGD